MPRIDGADDRTRTAVQQAYDNERANPGGWKEWHAKTDMKSSNDRPTKKQQKRPTHEDIPDETAVQLSSRSYLQSVGSQNILARQKLPGFFLARPSTGTGVRDDSSHFHRLITCRV